MKTCVETQATEHDRSRHLIGADASVAVALRLENTNYSGRAITSDAPGHVTSPLSCRFAAYFVPPESRRRMVSGTTNLTLVGQDID